MESDAGAEEQCTEHVVGQPGADGEAADLGFIYFELGGEAG